MDGEMEKGKNTMNETNNKNLDPRVEKEIYKYFIRDYADTHLEKSPKGDKKAYVCPFCGSGTGANGTGALSIDPKTNLFKCFSCNHQKTTTNSNGEVKKIPNDIYALIQQVEGIGTFKDQLQRARELYQPFISEITGDESKMAKIMERVGTQANTTYNNTQQGSYKAVDERKQRIEQIQAERRNNATTLQKHANNGYLYNSQQNLFNNKRLMAYLEDERHLDRQTIINAFIGYDEDEDCLILPANTDRDAQYSYYVRHYPGNRETKYKNADRETCGTPQIYNVNALYESKPCYICEGIYDALSIMQTYPNANAIALYGVSNIKKLEDELLIAKDEGKTIKAPLIACMDNDEPGRQANHELMTMLEKHKLRPTEAKFSKNYTKCKDVNEMLIDNGNQLKKDILNTCKLARRNKSDQCNLYDYFFNGGYEEDREYFRAYKDRKTGYENIDKYFTTFPGLLALGGIAGLGKTTFAMNLAMNLIETQGQSVMYFALEQGKIDILNKVMARTLHIKALDGANQQQYKALHQQKRLDLTNLQIKKGYSNPLLEQSSKEWFTQYGERIEVIEADFNFTADEIGRRVERYIKKHNTTPIVIIDYLQLIAPPKGTDKREGIDEVVKALKSLQRKHDLFMIVISNFNRANYTDQVSYESFKETGMIEYTADYVWGLQLAVLGTKEYRSITASDKSEKREITMRENAKEEKPVALVSLKNRHGLAGWKAYFDFVASHDYFKEVIDLERIEEYEFGEIEKKEKKQSNRTKGKKNDTGHALGWEDEEIGEENLEGVLDCSVVVDGKEVKTDINGNPKQKKRNTRSKK